MGNKIKSSYNENISKYEHFTHKINKTYSHHVCPLKFLAISAVLSLLYHHCYSC